MMKRYSPLAGMAERRLRLGAVVQKDKEPEAADVLSPADTEVDEFTWNTVRDLTRDTDIVSKSADLSQESTSGADQGARDEAPERTTVETQKGDDEQGTSGAMPSMSADQVAEPKKRRSSRVKTTLLGFDRSDGRTEELFKGNTEKKTAEVCKFPTGWLVVTEGPGRGTAVALHEGVSQIGRGDDQAVQLDFGDNSISRENHAAVAYDEEARAFFLGHGGKTNIVRLNGTPVLSTEPLNHDDLIRIGETTMRFVAFCNSSFSWSDEKTD